MRISPSPLCDHDCRKPPPVQHRHANQGNVPALAKFLPTNVTYSTRRMLVAMLPSHHRRTPASACRDECARERGEVVDVQSTNRKIENITTGSIVTWIIFLGMRTGRLPLFCAIFGVGSRRIS